MRPLLEKLNYKGQKRIAILYAEKNFKMAPMKEIKDIRIDTEIDPRYPYDFMIIFVKKVAEVEKIAPMALHNLAVDGILWFCYPKKTSGKYSSDIDRDHGWKSLNDLNFFGIRIVAVDEDWSALRFRNKKYIKTVSERFAVKK
ncbi:MAG: hypothetical protein A2V50_00015 [Bacteroidetes bacterium RBG_19FT_COMBO_42_10]|nr:MAG: hypothetical protein A2V50_00015 [Bacteroidetes bacterium RBG_19FT_COMBO_42_10]